MLKAFKNSRIRRRLVQFTAMLVYNADVKRWFTGGISTGPLKKVCVPGLNCYSCPGAVASCPLGSLQNTIGNGKFPFFVTGFLLLTGTLFGRMVCSFLCPFGLVQELLYKIPLPKLKKTQKTLGITRKISILKYLVLAFMCILIPAFLYFKNGISSPLFCKWFCPAGTIFAGWPLTALNEYLRSAAGHIFLWKSAVAVSFILWSVFMYRPFCRFFCPLGAVYSFFNKTAIFGIRVDNKKCTHCNACTNFCKMDVLKINDRECIRCGECIERCKFGAIE